MLRKFYRNESGQIAVIFAIMALPLIGFSTLAIDYAKASQVRTNLKAAADSAAFAAANALKTSNLKTSEVREVSLAFVETNFKVEPTARLELDTQIGKKQETVTVELAYHWSPIVAHHFDGSFSPIKVETIANVTKGTTISQPKTTQTQKTNVQSGSCREILKDRKTRDILKRYNIVLSERHCRAMNNARR